MYSILALIVYVVYCQKKVIGQKFTINSNISQRFITKISTNNISCIIWKEITGQKFIINSDTGQRFMVNIGISYRLKIYS